MIHDDHEGLREAFVSDVTALKLGKQWLPQRNPYSHSWGELVRTGRPLLMELACYQDSVLSQEVIDRYGPGSAIRCAEWNGCNLETSQGVATAKAILRHEKPVHLWVACECSPFCPLQRLNRGSPEQAAALEEKQQRAKRQYAGAFEVAKVAKAQGTIVHLELSERCEAWKLPLLQEVVQHLGLSKVTTHGCCVGLRTLDKKQLLCKGWTIASASDAILRHMNLRCQKNHKRAECRGKHASNSSRYTPVFARKVVDCFAESEVWSRVLQDIQSEAQGNATKSAHPETKHSKHDRQAATPAAQCHQQPQFATTQQLTRKPARKEGGPRQTNDQHVVPMHATTQLRHSQSEGPERVFSLQGLGRTRKRRRLEKKQRGIRWWKRELTREGMRERLSRNSSTFIGLPDIAVSKALPKHWKPGAQRPE